MMAPLSRFLATLALLATSLTVLAEEDAKRILGPLDDASNIIEYEHNDTSRVLLKIECPSCPNYKRGYVPDGTAFLYDIPRSLPSTFDPTNLETLKEISSFVPVRLNTQLDPSTAASAREKSRVVASASKFPVHGPSGLEVIAIQTFVSSYGDDADVGYNNEDSDIDSVQLFLSRKKVGGSDDRGRQMEMKRDAQTQIQGPAENVENAELWTVQWWQIVPMHLIKDCVHLSKGQLIAKMPPGLQERLDQITPAGSSSSEPGARARQKWIGPWNAIQVWMLAAAVVTTFVGTVYVAMWVVRVVKRATVETCMQYLDVKGDSRVEEKAGLMSWEREREKHSHHRRGMSMV